MTDRDWRVQNQPRRVIRAAKRLAQARRDRGVAVPAWEEMSDHVKYVYLEDARSVIRGDDKDATEKETPTDE
jgi:hypothetical protein